MKLSLPPSFRLILIFGFLFFISGCKKIKEDVIVASPASATEVRIPENFFKQGTIPGVQINKPVKGVQSASFVAGSPADNGDDPVILGNKLENPYTVSNMQKAYDILYSPVAFTGTPGTGGHNITANNLYVRFKPSDPAQISALEDSASIELQDYPMDYEVVQEGDYYQDPALGTEETGWLYAVVPVGYVPPAGIQYEVIEQLYIPDNNLVLESMAESLATGGTYRSTP